MPSSAVRLLAVLACACALVLPASAGAGVVAPGAIETASTTTTVAPGIELQTVDSYDRTSIGWMRTYVLIADLDVAGVRPDLIGGTVSGGRRTSAMADQAGAVAATNGDFFTIDQTTSAIGPEVMSGQLRKATLTGDPVTALGTDGMLRMATLALDGTLTTPTGTLPLASLNSQDVSANGIGLLTPRWGTGARSFIASSGTRTEVIVAAGHVTRVTTGAYTTDPIPSDGFVLVGRGTGATSLAALHVGDAVSVDYRPRVTPDGQLAMAVHGNIKLVTGGTVEPIPSDVGNDALKPRTAIGFTAGGRRLILAAIDGNAISRGASIQEIADLMGRLGAREATNIDGGGSTTVVARRPGDARTSLVNVPSDTNERVVANGVGLFARPGSGALAAIAVDTDDAEVFPGLSRTLALKGLDDANGPAALTTPAWAAEPARRAHVGADGVARADRSGPVTLRASDGGASGEAKLIVLGRLSRLGFDVSSAALEEGTSTTVRVVGADLEGFTAAVEPRDVQLSYDDTVVAVAPTADGAYRLTGRPGADGRGTVLRARVQGHRASIAVTVGYTTSNLSPFDDVARWAISTARATGSVAIVPSDRPGAPAGDTALRLSYNFTGQPSGTSAAYANARPGAITLPPGTKRLALWVKGDGGKPHWLRATLRSQGTTNVPFTFIDPVEAGWHRVEGTIPDGFSDPITLTQVYLVETADADDDAGEIVVDGLDARLAQNVIVPPAEPQEDPVVIRQGTVSDGRWRFAAVSDFHTTAAGGPTSFAQRQARQALRAMREANPDFILVDGDAVDTNTIADFQMFEAMLHDEVPGIPVYWAPGNHESGAVANGTLTNFTATTGRPTRQAFDHKGLRVIQLNSTLGGLRSSDWDQVPYLKAQLDAAASDASIEGVLVALHHPPYDVSGGGASQLGDGREAALLRRWLADFRERSGKQAALFTGHAHTASGSRLNGVVEVTTPSVGKTPYAPPDRGGFFGWMLVGVDPAPAPLRPGLPDPESTGWLRAEVRPVIDGLTMDAPAELEAGASDRLDAKGLTSGFNLAFPLRYPASVRYSGDGLAVVEDSGDDEAMLAARRDRDTRAILDTSDLELYGVRAGPVEVRASAGGLSQQTTFEVVAPGLDDGAQRTQAVRAGRVDAQSGDGPPLDDLTALDLTLALCELSGVPGTPAAVPADERVLTIVSGR